MGYRKDRSVGEEKHEESMGNIGNIKKMWNIFTTFCNFSVNVGAYVEFYISMKLCDNEHR